MSSIRNIRAGGAYVEITADTSPLQRHLTHAQAQLRAFGQAATSIGKDLLGLAGTLSLPIAASVRSFAGFDDQMRLVQAVTQATTTDFENLTQTAQRLGRETSFTAQQVAEGMTSLGRMGFSPKEIEAAIGSVLNLSRATGTELAESADIAANALRIYGLEADKMASVSDILTATANGSAQTLHDLFEGLKIVGPQAKAASESITDTCAALGVLANVGIKGSLAGTALRKSFSQFTKLDVQEQLAAFDISTTVNGKLRKTADIMSDIAKVMNGMPSAEKLRFAEDIFDIRGSLAGLSLGGNIDELDGFLEKLHDVAGTAETTAIKMDAGLGGSFRLLQSAAEGSMNAIGSAVEGALQPLVERFTAAINATTRWIEANGDLVVRIGKAVVGVAAFGASLIAIGATVKAISSSVALLSSTFRVLTNVQAALFGLHPSPVEWFKSLSTAVGLFRQSASALAATSLSTAERLAALSFEAGQLAHCLNLPLATQAQKVAAALLMMGNAQAAATARMLVAAKVQAVANALKGLSASTIAATISTKAHTAALAVCSLGTKALAGARAFAASVTGFFSLANLKATAASIASSAANLALAGTTKLVAAGYILATKAAAAFCAIPISWVFLGIAAGLVALCASLAKASRHTAQLTDKMVGLREQGDELRKTDQLRMERLQQLADKENLSNAEMAEAQKLSSVLTSRYGDLGVSIDTVAGKLSMAADAQVRLNEAMKAASLAEIDAEMAEYKANLNELERENASLASGSFGGRIAMSWRALMSGDTDATSKLIEENGAKADVILKKLYAAKARRRAIAGGDRDAFSGSKPENEKLQEAIATEESRVTASREELANAAKRTAEIERRLSREKRTDLENELSDIRELRDEYKALIQTMLDFERSKTNANTERIAELEAKLAQADRDADERIRKVQEKASAEFDSLQRDFDETAGEFTRRREDAATDREVDTVLREDPSKGISMLEGLIAKASQAVESARTEFATALAEARADGTLSDEERDRIDSAKTAYSLAESLLDKYSDKLRSAQEGTRKASETTTKPVGAFYAKAIEALGGKDVQQRMASATEAIAKNTKHTNDLLKRTAGSSTLAFG